MIFPFPSGAFSGKHQVVKSILIKKSFLTVILCYCVNALLLDNQG